jgi:large subunit ribosomal protein L24
MSLRIKRDDMVLVLAGRDKGARGKVLSVDPKKGTAIVEGVNIIKHGITMSFAIAHLLIFNAF